LRQVLDNLLPLLVGGRVIERAAVRLGLCDLGWSFQAQEFRGALVQANETVDLTEFQLLLLMRSFQPLQSSGGKRTMTRRPSLVWRSAVRSAAARPASS
jgi:hypothetical protein